MIPTKKETIPQDERRITIPEDIYLGLEDIAAEERKKQPNEVLKALITQKSLAQSVLKNFVLGYSKKAGYRVGKVKEI
jgi:hypothetical protein